MTRDETNDLKHFGQELARQGEQIRQMGEQINAMQAKLESLLGERNKAVGFLLFAAAIVGSVGGEILTTIRSIFTN